MLQRAIENTLNYFGKLPKTKYLQYPDSVKVSLIDYPDIKRVKKVFVDFVASSW
jgi:hypothetical protein